MSRPKPYTENFYRSQQEGSLRSAEEIVSLLIKLIDPKSVIDLGCGVGTWLSAFKKVGVEDIQGVDGEWVNRKMLKIPNDRFLTHDMVQPIYLPRQFDLVMSLEVAEHLPKECAALFVDSLTRLGPVVLFSAAIPFQGGANHVNEQWPDYWAKLFLEKNYIVVDCIRKHIWNNDEIKYWYSQNIMIYVKIDFFNKYPLLQHEFKQSNNSMLSIVHPKHYLLSMSNRNFTLKQLISILPHLISKAVNFRLKKLSKYFKPNN